MVYFLLRLVDVIFTLYSIAIIARLLLPLLGMSYYHPAMRFLVQITEPLLGPLRRRIPPLGMFDLSSMVALIILWIIEETLKMLIVSLF